MDPVAMDLPGMARVVTRPTAQTKTRRTGHNGRPMETTRGLMQGIIDFAGLFPPASLDMQKTVAAYARYRASVDHWALGRLIVPLKRIGEFERCATEHLPTGDTDDSEEPWRLSVLCEATGDESFEDELDAIERFNARHGEPGAGRAVIETLEIKPKDAHSIEGALELMPETLFPWFELPWWLRSVRWSPEPRSARVASPQTRILRLWNWHGFFPPATTLMFRSRQLLDCTTHSAIVPKVLGVISLDSSMSLWAAHSFTTA
jgi:hypothetical protein